MPRRRSLVVVASVGLAVLVTAGLASRREQAVGLAEYLGWRDASTPAMVAREAQAVQQHIAECMAARGLVYVEFTEPALEVPDADLGPREWAAKWGFGVSTSVGVADTREPSADPNLAYIDSLSPGERDAYRSALLGRASSPGCSAEANDAVYGRHDRLLAGLATDLTGLEDQIARDPRTVDADARWLTCVSSPDFRPSSRRTFGREAIEFVGRRLDAILDPSPGAADVDRDALERLQALEIDLAVRGIDCDEMVRPTLESVRLEYESRFVEANRAALDDIKGRAEAVDAELGLAPALSLDLVSFEP